MLQKHYTSTVPARAGTGQDASKAGREGPWGVGGGGQVGCFWLDRQNTMTLNLSQVVGLYIIIEIAPYILLDLIIALLGILHGCVLILAQPLLHSSLKDMKPSR